MWDFSSWSPLKWAGWMLCLMLACVQACAAVGASESNRPLLLENQASVQLAPYLDVLKDPERRLRLKDITGLTRGGDAGLPKFVPLQGDKLMLDDPGSNYWVRLTVTGAFHSETPQAWYLHNHQQPSARHIQYFEPNSDGTFRHVETGDLETFSSRDVDNPSYLFKLTLAPGETKTVYLLLDEVLLPRGVPLMLRSQESYQDFDRFSWMLISGYYSVVMALFIYNLLLWLKLREKPQLFYLGYIAAFVLSMMNVDGMNALLVERGWIDLSGFSDEAFVLLMLIVQLLFVANMLELKEQFPAFAKIYRGLMGYMAVVTVAYFAIGRAPAMQALFAVAMAGSWLFLLVAIVQGIRRNAVGAKNLLLAEICMIGGYLVATLAYYGVMPASDFTSFMPAKVGNLLQLIFFSMVIGEKARVAILKSAEDQHKLKQAEVAAATAQALSCEDPLTGLYNRRAFFDFGRQLFTEARRCHQSCAVIMIDIDHFKSINDNFGHAAGDQAICLMANLCKETARNSDVLGRLGGEEFALVLGQTDLNGATLLAERLRTRLAETHMALDEGEISMTASFGLAVLKEDDHAIEDMLKRADKALYQAKSDGRNRVSIEDDRVGDHAPPTKVVPTS